ncbi:uncharacterized protein LOC108097860 [Drosophila ficusphila]|uniref:uncharacterized protein LOC108097860 n=1 Tax=Drosophila ficusphila TaxID=30025 RepID=UPI0007E6CC02|nr:uncharacterized protein LOC108097860 [Drosophila ficusphila]
MADQEPTSSLFPGTNKFSSPNPCCSKELRLKNYSKTAYPSKKHRQSSKRSGTYRKIINFKWSSGAQKSQRSPMFLRHLVHKLKLYKRDLGKSSRPLFKAVILKEMIRLGRRPNPRFLKDVQRAMCIPKCNKTKNVTESCANQISSMEIAEISQVKPSCEPTLLEPKIDLFASPLMENDESGTAEVFPQNNLQPSELNLDDQCIEVLSKLSI